MADSEIFLHSGNLKYPAESTKLYCPDCGEQKVIVEKGDGDYYSGPMHLCLVCRSLFHLC